MTGPGAATREVVVRFPTHPHSVRTARQLVTDTLRDWGLESLVEDARLVVTELSTNATLHSGARAFTLRMAPTTAGGVRLAVGDDGAVPADAVVPARRVASATATAVRPATTGRGLAIVDELADAWGVTDEDTRKWVWAELAPDGTDPGSTPGDGPTAPASDELPGALPPGWHVVHLVDCPVALSLAQDEHLDDLVRELQLVLPRSDEPELAQVIRGLLDGQAQARHMGRRTAQDAAAEGRERVTVAMVLPSAAAEQVEQLHAAVAAADALCEREQLLTLASPPEVRQVRTWMRDELRDQIRSRRRPRSYDEWRTSGG